MKVHLSERLEPIYGHFDWQQVTIGCSKARVYQIEKFILKIQDNIGKTRTYIPTNYQANT